MTVYVVRWESRIDGETESGNFNPCYAELESAKKAMLDDMEKTKKDWELDGFKVNGMVSDRGTYCDITCEDCDTYDYHEWHIDTLELVNHI